MPDRKYSLDEIDRMRSAVRLTFGRSGYNPIERNADVENRLRTYMQNGTEPGELEEHGKRIMAEEWALYDRAHK